MHRKDESREPGLRWPRLNVAGATLLLTGAIMALTVLFPVTTPAARKHSEDKREQIPANLALTGVPLDLTPDQLPNQFRTQLREDVNSYKGFAILRQKGNDVEYTFAWEGLTSPVISGHFHKAPHGQVGVRAYSICGVANESPPCPAGTRTVFPGFGRTPISMLLDVAKSPLPFIQRSTRHL